MYKLRLFEKIILFKTFSYEFYNIILIQYFKLDADAASKCLIGSIISYYERNVQVRGKRILEVN